MSTASKVAERKAKKPELYCPQPGCLWRTGGERCPRHKVREAKLDTQRTLELLDESQGGL
jgi:hypothetical protein